MKQETQVIGDCAVTRLDKLLHDIEQETQAVVQQNDIQTAITHYAAFRDLLDSLKERTSALERHAQSLSYQTLPTMFTNQNVKTINVVGVGRVTINVRWNATMHDKEQGMEWLRATGNGGLIIETVNAGTLTSFARAEALRVTRCPKRSLKSEPRSSPASPRAECPMTNVWSERRGGTNSTSPSTKRLERSSAWSTSSSWRRRIQRVQPAAKDGRTARGSRGLPRRGGRLHRRAVREMTITFISPIKPHLSHREAFPMPNELTEPRETNISEFLRKQSTGASFGNIDASDLKPPRLKVLAGQSPEVLDGVPGALPGISG